MLKIMGLVAALTFVACTSMPAHADCPGGHCPNGTVDPGTPADRERARAEEARRQAQCLSHCQFLRNTRGAEQQYAVCKEDCEGLD
jgi:hypothetical protein